MKSEALKMERPISITVISYFAIISVNFGGIAMLVRMYNRNPDLYVELLKTPTIIGMIVATVAAIGVLKGLNWARILFCGWLLFNIVRAFILFTDQKYPIEDMILRLLPALCIFVISSYFLFRKKAEDFFRHANSVKSAD